MNKVQRYYDSFDEWARLASPEGRLEWARSLELLERWVPPASRVLDLGGGPGRYTAALAQRGHRVTLVDLSPRQVEVARARISDAGLDAETLLGDARDLSAFAPATFDAVLAFGPFYHLVDSEHRRIAMGEVARVLRPGGRLLLAFLPRASGLRGLIARAAAAPDQVSPRTLARCREDGVFLNEAERGFQEGWYPTVPEVRALVEASGFGIDRVESLRGLLASHAAALWGLEERSAALFEAAMELLRDTAAEPGVVELGDHAVVVGTLGAPPNAHTINTPKPSGPDE